VVQKRSRNRETQLNYWTLIFLSSCVAYSGVSSQRNERKECQGRKNGKLQPIGTEPYSFLLNSFL